jgi:hypothetical protein
MDHCHTQWLSDFIKEGNNVLGVTFDSNLMWPNRWLIQLKRLKKPGMQSKSQEDILKQKTYFKS